MNFFLGWAICKNRWRPKVSVEWLQNQNKFTWGRKFSSQKPSWIRWPAKVISRYNASKSRRNGTTESTTFRIRGMYWFFQGYTYIDMLGQKTHLDGWISHFLEVPRTFPSFSWFLFNSFHNLVIKWPSEKILNHCDFTEIVLEMKDFRMRVCGVFFFVPFLDKVTRDFELVALKTKYPQNLEFPAKNFKDI